MKLIKLLLGAIFFIALCGSGMMLIVLFLGFFEGHVNLRSLMSLMITVFIFSISSIALYYLSKETLTPQLGEKSKRFKARKLKLQLLVIALIAIFIVGIPFAAGTIINAQIEAAIISIVFFWLYVQIAKRLWRCPECESQLPFMTGFNSGQSIKSCPNCNAQLQ